MKELNLRDRFHFLFHRHQRTLEIPLPQKIHGRESNTLQQLSPPKTEETQRFQNTNKINIHILLTLIKQKKTVNRASSQL